MATTDPKKLIIFDTTLRDGEQSPGASMTLDEKLRIAKALERLNVDVIEAGFPAASPGDFEAVKAVAEASERSTICGLARAMERDIAAAGQAIEPAESKRIHTFIATSPIHMESKLQMTPAEVLERAAWAVSYAKQFTDNIEFSPEDAGRSDFAFLCEVIEAAIEAGATTINIPDTVGYNLPNQFGSLFKRLIETIPNSHQAIFSSHCHNDLGVAVANSLAAVKNGARQVECTINGLGERAGNASLEEVVMAVRVRQDLFDCDTQLNTQELMNCSRLVSSITGFPVQPNKAIVGANAFAHESGIHQDGVLKKRETYEIMSAEDVGWNANKMVLGKHSGRNAFRNRCEALGIQFTDDESFNQAFVSFKELADKKHDIFDEDIQALASDAHFKEEERVKLIKVAVNASTGEAPSAVVTLDVDGEEKVVTATGDGLVDAIFQAIESVVNTKAELLLFTVNAITGGTDSQGGVTVRLEQQGRLVNGRGSDTDIIFASAKAYVNGVNQLLSPKRTHPQAADV